MPYFPPASGTFTLTGTKSAAYTAVSGDWVVADANAASGNFAVTLPASPSAGDRVKATLITDHATRKVTIDRNGSNIMGGTSTTFLDLVLENDTLEFHYVGGDCGWFVEKHLLLHKCQVARSAAQSIATGGAKVAVDAEVFDVGGIGDIATNDRIDIRRAGYYLVHSFGSTASPNQDQRAEVYLNGAVVISGGIRTSGVGISQSQVNVHAPVEMLLASGDYLELYIVHNNGSAQNTGTEVWRRPTLTVMERP